MFFCNPMGYTTNYKKYNVICVQDTFQINLFITALIGLAVYPFPYVDTTCHCLLLLTHELLQTAG